MGKRRGNQEGSIYQDRHGVWWAQLPSDGGKRPKRRAATRKEAQQKLAQMEHDRMQGVDLSLKQPTVEEFLKTWLTDVVTPSRRPKTTRGYRDLIHLHVIPHIGHRRLDKLTAAHVQQMCRVLLGKLSPTSVRSVHKVLHIALERAREWHMVAHNVAKSIELPSVPRYRVTPLTEDQAKILLAAAEGDRFEVLYLIVVAYGLRRGEALGLHWSDLDWDRKLLKISRQVLVIGKEILITAVPKTAASTRTVHLSDDLITDLRAHWQRQQQERRGTGINWHEHGLMFPGEDGGPYPPSNFAHRFKRLLQSAGLPHIRFHDLRHSAASLMLARGVPLTAVSEILGHANASITAGIYGHAYESDKIAAAEEMSKALRRKKTS